MSIALWAEIETLKRRVAQLEARAGTGDGDVLYRMAERITALEQRPQPRKAGRPPKNQQQAK